MTMEAKTQFMIINSDNPRSTNHPKPIFSLEMPLATTWLYNLTSVKGSILATSHTHVELTLLTFRSHHTPTSSAIPKSRKILEIASWQNIVGVQNLGELCNVGPI
jgi:hypothetical protein